MKKTAAIMLLIVWQVFGGGNRLGTLRYSLAEGFASWQAAGDDVVVVGTARATEYPNVIACAFHEKSFLIFHPVKKKLKMIHAWELKDGVCLILVRT